MKGFQENPSSPCIFPRMTDQHFEEARMRMIGGEAFLIDEQGYVFHAETGELGHIEDCIEFSEMVWHLIRGGENEESI